MSSRYLCIPSGIDPSRPLNCQTLDQSNLVKLPHIYSDAMIRFNKRLHVMITTAQIAGHSLYKAASIADLGIDLNQVHTEDSASKKGSYLCRHRIFHRDQTILTQLYPHGSSPISIIIILKCYPHYSNHAEQFTHTRVK